MIPSHAIICPLSPSNSEPAAADEDDGWADLESAPIRADAASASAAPKGDDIDDVVDEDGEVVQLPRGVPPPPEPTADEISRHNLTHFPYRAWCPQVESCRCFLPTTVS